MYTLSPPLFLRRKKEEEEKENESRKKKAPLDVWVEFAPGHILRHLAVACLHVGPLPLLPVRRRTLIWFCTDRRLHDHESFHTATEVSSSLLPIFDPRDFDKLPPGFELSASACTALTSCSTTSLTSDEASRNGTRTPTDRRWRFRRMQRLSRHHSTHRCRHLSSHFLGHRAPPRRLA